MKSTDSLARKIDADAEKDHGGDREKAANAISDAVTDGACAMRGGGGSSREEGPVASENQRYLLKRDTSHNHHEGLLL